VRTPRIPSGLKPLTRAERRRLTRENRRALFPSIALERYEATVRAVEAIRRAKLEQLRAKELRTN
jgi:hypothetical protein